MRGPCAGLARALRGLARLARAAAGFCFFAPSLYEAQAGAARRRLVFGISRFLDLALVPLARIAQQAIDLLVEHALEVLQRSLRELLQDLRRHRAWPRELGALVVDVRQQAIHRRPRHV